MFIGIIPLVHLNVIPKEVLGMNVMKMLKNIIMKSSDLEIFIRVGGSTKKLLTGLNILLPMIFLLKLQSDISGTTKVNSMFI